MESLREYSQFDTVKEMDEFISKVLAHFDLKKTERELLWIIAGHSCKFIGVSFLKLASMAKAMGVSKKTIQRALKALSELGIIKRIRTLRPVRGGFGASITVICPVDLSTREEANEPAPEGTQEPKKKKEAFPFKAYSKDIKYIRQPESIDYTYLEEWLPQEFIKAVKPFVSPEEAFSLWGKVQVASKRYAPSVINVLEPAIRAFKASVLAYKARRIKKSFGGYFWGSLCGVLGVEQRRACKSGIDSSWLFN
ncbi:helix-turn-helix protein [Scopulibacillus darangshiensis]|uniref:Helix-turn-helix protein n=1 Tax=Scopulibacillus darangshiensis TaxID=442528 RepID=A0A4R2P4C3_9BACL|nr:helix-turn-helix domain-containing protein [Scopulibacillus darangshiensis]TCP28781.1 helix-turn-helix protein [Scopulibacillus darangshiensis]